MKLAFEFTGVVIVNEDQQAAFLNVLANSSFYTNSSSWNSTTYEPTKEVPTIKFVDQSNLLGYEVALEKAKISASEDSSKYWKLYNENTAANKLLKEAQDKIDELSKAHAETIIKARVALFDNVGADVG